MDVSPVLQAGPPLVAGLITMLIGLVLPGALRKVTVVAGALLALACLAVGGFYVGTAYAIEAWERKPEVTAVGLVVLMSLTAFTMAAKSNRKHNRDEDEEDEGGLGVYSPTPPQPAAPAPSPVPAPSGPGVDWTDFDAQREEWSHEPDREPVGV